MKLPGKIGSICRGLILPNAWTGAVNVADANHRFVDLAWSE
jgi:hypothetical protein